MIFLNSDNSTEKLYPHEKTTLAGLTYDLHKWIKDRICARSPEQELRDLEELGSKKTKPTAKELLIFVVDSLSYYALSKLVSLAKPDIQSETSAWGETEHEMNKRLVIKNLKKVYPKQHGILVATYIMTQIGSCFLPKSWEK